MIISDTKRFIFLHNPKAAGTSIRQTLLLPHDTKNNFYWGMASGGPLKRPVDKAHLAIEDLKILYPEAYNLLHEYFVFAFIRHPYERFISSFYEYAKHHDQDLNLKSKTTRQLSTILDDFIVNALSHEKIRHVYKYRHFIPQHCVLYDEKKCMVDYIGRVNNLHKDLSSITQIIGLNMPLKLGELNRASTSNTDIHEVLLPRTKDLVRRLYEKDFLYLGFDY